MKSPRPFYAIGHSTRPIETFLEILKAHGVTLVADIRTVPRSRHNPQYDQTALKQSLKEAGLKYRHFESLGGLCKPRPDSVNKAWRNTGFRGYADYMQTPSFEKGVEQLLKSGEKETVAFMCAEGNPFRCHRSLLSDALTARGVPVYQISSARSEKLHSLTSFAQARKGKVLYPAKGDDGKRLFDPQMSRA